ncbi:MAG: flagellar biosynthesis protein FlgL, partial [Rhizobiales bacterium]|nr:flagellar biosynthesis protein FlgL [Hyphomicrobiales bacterium]
MTISGIGGRPAAVQQLLDMRSQLDDLQRQLGTGKRSATYAGQGGLVSGLGVALRTQLANIDGYGQTTTTVAVRLQLAQNALTGMTNVATNVKTSLIQPGIVGSNGQTTTQLQARDQLDQLLNLLNTKADGRSLFSGRATDQRAVVPTDTLLNGDGVRAGLKQVIDERRQADLGASGLGRLVLGSPSSGAVSIAEDAVGSPFGFKIASITSDIAGATVSAPAGSPPAAGIDFSAATPQPGQSVSLTLNLPDGTTTTVKLTATNASPPGAGEFTIGADAATTAANLQSSLTSALTGEAKTSLLAASAMTAGNDFFNLDATHV